MEFEDKVRSMTIKEIVMAMIEGLENPTTRVDMATYGMAVDVWGKGKVIQKNVCFGCAATNTIAHIAGVTFTSDNIGDNDTRAEAVKSDKCFLDRFESAINLLRSADLHHYNTVAEMANIATIPDELMGERFNLPELTTESYKENLPAWLKFAEKL